MPAPQLETAREPHRPRMGCENRTVPSPGQQLVVVLRAGFGTKEPATSCGDGDGRERRSEDPKEHCEAGTGRQISLAAEPSM